MLWAKRLQVEAGSLYIVAIVLYKVTWAIYFAKPMMNLYEFLDVCMRFNICMDLCSYIQTQQICIV